MGGEKLRLDVLLSQKGIAATRSKAADLIRQGGVSVNGRIIGKPGALVPGDGIISLADEAPQPVSRAGHKLQAALDHFQLSPQGLIALDIGASTGGFTEVLLKAGAVKVYAVDVGHGQLAAELATDPRVVSLEGVNARDLDAARVADPVGIIVADVSFVSLLKVLPQPLTLASEGCLLVALVKPQFEVGPQFIGKGGIVKDEQASAEAVARIEAFIGALPGWQVLGIIPSPLRGRGGNQEYLIAARQLT